MRKHQLDTSYKVEERGTNSVANLVEFGVNSDEIVGDAEGPCEEKSHTQGESGKIH